MLYDYEGQLKPYLKKWGFTSFDNKLPILVLHGLGDQCQTDNIREIKEVLIGINKFYGTKIYIECIDLLWPGVQWLESMASNFVSLSIQAAVYCAKVQLHEVFGKEDFNMIGLSQGALIGRYIIEGCKIKGKVRNFISIGGP